MALPQSQDWGSLPFVERAEVQSVSKRQPSEIESIEATLDRIERERPSLKPIAEAFREVLVSRARIKAGLPDYSGPPLPSPEPQQQSQGVPLLTPENIAGLMDPWGQTAAATIPPLARAFPGIAAESRRLKHVLDTGEADLGQCLRALLIGDNAEMDRMASRLGLQAKVLAFLLGQMLKPFVEKRTQPLQMLVRRLPWHRAYCPVCGSFAEITYLEGEGGQRWLRCSLCGYQWQFNRMLCTRCEAQFQKKNLIHVEGRRHEFAELCGSCRHYMVGVDLREAKGETITPATAIGLLHLDMVAQDRGYEPVAVTAWNVIGPALPDAERKGS